MLDYFKKYKVSPEQVKTQPSEERDYFSASADTYKGQMAAS